MARLFPKEVPTRAWSTFHADGFSDPVSGMVLGPTDARCGLPLGGIGTGCIDLNPDGTLGRCSVFNSFAPPRELSTPFLAVRASGRDYCVATQAPRGFAVPNDVKYWG